MHDFFYFYAHNIEGTMFDMSESELRDHLDSDIFVGCASSATDIPEGEFIEYAVNVFFKKKKRVKA